jgi:hypothetical protein
MTSDCTQATQADQAATELLAAELRTSGMLLGGTAVALLLPSGLALADNPEVVNPFFTFSPVCPASDGIFRVGQGLALGIAGTCPTPLEAGRHLVLRMFTQASFLKHRPDGLRIWSRVSMPEPSALVPFASTNALTNLVEILSVRGSVLTTAVGWLHRSPRRPAARRQNQNSCSLGDGQGSSVTRRTVGRGVSVSCVSDAPKEPMLAAAPQVRTTSRTIGLSSTTC